MTVLLQDIYSLLANDIFSEISKEIDLVIYCWTAKNMNKRSGILIDIGID